MLFLEGSFFTDRQDVKANNKKAKLSLFIQQKNKHRYYSKY
jgi:hypothetical protein